MVLDRSKYREQRGVGLNFDVVERFLQSGRQILDFVGFSIDLGFFNVPQRPEVGPKLGQIVDGFVFSGGVCFGAQKKYLLPRFSTSALERSIC